MASQITYYQRTLKVALYYLAACLLCRVTNGYFSIVMVLAGVWFAIKRRYGIALSLFVIFPFMMIVSHALIPKPKIMAYMIRFGPLLIGLVLAAVSSGLKGSHVLPFGALIPYLVAAAISSVNGYAPMVSYMKLINFTLFLVAIWLGIRNLHHHTEDIQIVRSAILAMSCILILGSLAILPWPTIAYGTSFRGEEYSAEVYDLTNLAASRAAYAQSHGYMDLFSGITFHSQALGPLAGCVFVWVLCDMVFLERKLRWLHMVVLVASLPVLYLTRSRCALLVVVAGMLSVMVFTKGRVRLPMSIRRKISTVFLALVACMAVVGTIGEIRNHTMSRWIRKTDNVANDARTTAEAFTQSRSGLIEEMIRDYRRNPLLGCGFQVDEYSARIAKRTSGLVLSVPIEKGVLPLMILGEGGIVGAMAFVFFLFAFSGICVKKHFFVTVAFLGVLLAVNLGEATFFSPGGPGGIEWCICIIGGFVIDTIILYPDVWRPVIRSHGVRQEDYATDCVGK